MLPTHIKFKPAMRWYYRAASDMNFKPHFQILHVFLHATPYKSEILYFLIYLALVRSSRASVMPMQFKHRICHYKGEKMFRNY